MRQVSRRLALAAAALAAATALAAPRAADATSVTYTTTGGFGNNTSSSYVVQPSGFNNLKFEVDFQNESTAMNVSTPADSALGVFTVKLSGLGFANQDFNTSTTVNVLQTVPSSGQGSFNGPLTGNLVGYGLVSDANHVEVSFNNTSINLGGITYDLEVKVLGVYVPLSTFGGVLDLGALGTVFSGSSIDTTLYAHISGNPTVASVPEPTTIMMSLTGAIALAGARLRSRKRAAA